ncbi:MAG: GTP 3',8-cyclase MoaA [Candidatus Omnitrophica bacterium]|nr:GTP 3',8-cyclase MoaA [Candidatus Omnitrophota bacterium]
MRISVTDQCNLRCTYCTPCCGLDLYRDDEKLSSEQIVRLGRIFAGLGVTRVRFTGGEPLLRKDILSLVAAFKNIPGIEQVHLTTNGILLGKMAAGLKQAGLDGLNVSLDTLVKERFKALTGFDGLSDVLTGIALAQKTGFENIKVNAVIMAGKNDDEIFDLIGFFKQHNLIGRFIEFMAITPLWDEQLYFSIERIQALCRSRYIVEPSLFRSLGPAEYYSLDQTQPIGFIHTVVENCQQCSRLRLSASGKLKICLYEEQGLSLKPLLSEMTDSELAVCISERIKEKNKIDHQFFKNRQIYMSQIGG